MGAVYKAVHLKLKKVMALKILPAYRLKHPEALARFEREMQAVGRLSHPHIVQAFDAGEIDGTHYLAMEYVEGSDLSQLVRKKGPLSVNSACRAVRQAAKALAAAHKTGLVHRDIKPANLLADRKGQIRVLDLGLASLGDDEDEHPNDLTEIGSCFGTPDYMAPEQWDDTHSADARSDLYALGCTLYFLLVGHAPYETKDLRSTLKKLSAHACGEIPDLKAARDSVPDGVVAIYNRLMAKNPAERFQSAAALVEALEPFTRKGGSEPSISRESFTLSYESLPVAESEPPSQKPAESPRDPQADILGQIFAD